MDFTRITPERKRYWKDGWAEGWRVGWEKGIKEGYEEGRKNIRKLLTEDGRFTPDEIAAMLGLPQTPAPKRKKSPKS